MSEDNLEPQDTTKSSEEVSGNSEKPLEDIFFPDKEEESKEEEAAKEADTDKEEKNEESDTKEDEPEDSESDKESEDKKEAGKEGEKTDKELKLAKSEDSLLSDADVTRIEKLAKDQGLSQKQAEELLSAQSEAVANYKQAETVKFEGIKESWVDELYNDKEFGGERFNENIENGKRALKYFAPTEFQNALKESGFGNHPGLVKTFAKIGSFMADDKFVSSSAPGGKKLSDEEIFFGEN